MDNWYYVLNTFNDVIYVIVGLQILGLYQGYRDKRYIEFFFYQKCLWRSSNVGKRC
jgi:hypothetical protein